MARYRYEGPGPVEDDDGHLVRPGDVAEFDSEPAWGPWRELPGDDPAQPPSAVTQPPAPPPGRPAEEPAPLKPTGTEGN